MDLVLIEEQGKRKQTMAEFIEEFGEGKLYIKYDYDYRKIKALYGNRATLNINPENNKKQNRRAQKK